jgi:hypothetical protein
MKPLRNPRQTRLTVVVMLFVWLLTLAAGVVNACQLHEDHATGAGGLAHGTQAAARSMAEHTAVSVGTAPATQQDDAEDQMAESIACQALCATMQSAVPKQKPLAFADPASEPVLVTGSGPVRVWPSLVAAAPGHARVPRPESPVFIRFLRLTL